MVNWSTSSLVGRLLPSSIVDSVVVIFVLSLLLLLGCPAARWRIEKLSVYIATATSAICSIRLAPSLYSADVCIL